MDAEARLEAMIAEFDDAVADRAREAVSWMRGRLPGAVIQVYDNYNALAIGFGSVATMRGLVFSIAVYPRWVSLFFAEGAALEDPDYILKGSGNQMRHIVLTSMELFNDPGVQALMAQALERRPIDRARPSELIIKSVSASRRLRRPALTS